MYRCVSVSVSVCVCVFLSSVQELLVNAYTRPAWESAVAEHEKEMYPIESVIATKLRATIASAGDRPQQLLREFSKCVA